MIRLLFADLAALVRFGYPPGLIQHTVVSGSSQFPSWLGPTTANLNTLNVF